MKKHYHTVLHAALMASAASATIAFNSGIVETVTIVTKNGNVRINKSDYDPETHTLADKPLRDDGPTIDEFIAAGYDPKNYPPKGYLSRSTDEEIAVAVKAKEDAEKPPVTPAQEPPQAATNTSDAGPQEPATTPAQRLVSQFGSKWFVVDGGGNKLEAEGIDAKGYKTEADAWKAVMALPAATPVA